MTEAEWMTCTNLEAMLEIVRRRLSGRKGNLLLCGICRQNWQLLYHNGSRECVEVVERYVDGQATEESLESAQYSAECPTFGFDFTPYVWKKWMLPGQLIPASVQRLVQMGVFTAQDLEQDEPFVDPTLKEQLLAAADLAYQAGSREPLKHPFVIRDISILNAPVPSLLRCIFGPLPFRPISVDDVWLASNVVSVSERIYDDRAFDRLTLLANALEAAGCSNADILKHCRSPGPHVRGCWVIDLLLGKE